MNDKEIEQEIQSRGLTAPRITVDEVNDAIASDAYYVFPGTTTTVCLLTLTNGFTVLGDSACASPENFNEDLGREIARDKAKDKVWELLGFGLREKLFMGAGK